MSVVIVGGNERMTRQYTDLCEEYRCRAKRILKRKERRKNKNEKHGKNNIEN